LSLAPQSVGWIHLAPSLIGNGASTGVPKATGTPKERTTL
jgi:hypothetical protein